MAEKYPRYSPKNSIGVNILTHFVNNIGWIPREVTNNDMGIDMYIEQVIDGEPTARFIAVQLKTGFGNVSINKRNGTFTVKNITEADKKYWDLSSCPVIVVFCDPETSTLYWTLYRHDVCRKTIVINPNNKLDKNSLFELNSIIEAYQKPFSLTEIDDSEIRNDPSYWTDLLDSCKEVIANSTNVFNQCHKKYESVISNSSKVLNPDNSITQKQASSIIKKQSHILSTTLNICRTQFQSQIPIIQETFIEAFSLFKYFSDAFNQHIKSELRCVIYEGLLELQEQIELSCEQAKEGEKKYRESNSKDYELKKSEYAFSLILSDYITSLQRMEKNISSLLQMYSK